MRLYASAFTRVSLSLRRTPPRCLPLQPFRQSSHAALANTKETTDTKEPTRPPFTVNSLRALYEKKEPVTMLTAHDAPSALAADLAGIDLILVGDSLAMVALGLEGTSEVALDTMLLYCRSVSRVVKSSFIVGDLPFGSYGVTQEQGVESAIRMIKEGRAHGIKLEGGAELAPTMASISRTGIPVFAHIGLTPQREHALGGFKPQGKSAANAVKIFHDALAAQKAGAVAVVLEAVPAEIAREITQRLRIPTIGIGAGSGCSGQVLVQNDMAGNFPPGRHIPKFVKQYGNVWKETESAIKSFREEVKNQQFPEYRHTYAMKSEELEKFKRIMDGIEGEPMQMER
ncbi:hypothetical protein EYZ11_004720 [Aspergillus tanneri]|uniref:3-methyl-2-oxobutanoate hydroxymethyltransferase n=1 Tax=Aspergillus tanneri TaxID=1220188 RepID=A0A4S3JKD7_9EURO|nr:uncharacterized protein ATNIH1004_006489 [Aspergillus tanneri]KAA8647788.1 hypothetical protein ATNIH1004_006489 [Aspergillus tanneri]THC95810.1 hypothetical protein EYZ11_004720 [Aspergillus tanneri]